MYLIDYYKIKMQIDFLIGNQIKYSAKIDLKKQDLFPNLYQDKKQKFKIPINVNIESPI